MINNTPIQTYNNDKSTLYIQQLQAGVTKELLFKEFTKFGQLKHVRHFPKTCSALIAYENVADAEEAKRNLNHTRILKKEISIAYFQDKDVLTQKKKFNLFIKNVPPTLETSVLHNFLQSEFGNIASLMLKKKNESEQNLGYGYVQFEKEEDFNKILQRQQDEGKITIANCDFTFSVQQFSSERPKTKTNKIHITGLFEKEISSEEKEAKYNEIMAVMEGIKRNLGDKQTFTIHTEYNDQKKSFWTMIEFSYSNDDEEDSIYQTVKEQIVQNFKYTTLPGGPQITFKANESSERNLILLGVKNDINESILAAWLLRVLGIVISEQNIRIRLPNSAQKAEPTPQPTDEKKLQTYSASLFFDSKKDGEKFMIFSSKSQNAKTLSEIFETKHKVTLFLKQEELNEIKKQTANMGNYYKGGNFQSSLLAQKTEIVDPKTPFPFMKMGQTPNPAWMQSMPFPMQTMQAGFYQPPVMQAPVLTPIAPAKEHVQAPTQNANKVNIFLQFQKLSPEEKKHQVEDISKKINSNKNEFNQIADEEGKRAILGQIIYYKIQNFGENNKAELVNELKKTPEEANRLITEFHQEVAKITGMLIDKEIFSIEEIIEIVLNPKELLERCLEATDLLTQNQQN